MVEYVNLLFQGVYDIVTGCPIFFVFYVTLAASLTWCSLITAVLSSLAFSAAANANAFRNN